MLLEHERNYILGMDALVTVCSWNLGLVRQIMAAMMNTLSPRLQHITSQLGKMIKIVKEKGPRMVLAPSTKNLKRARPEPPPGSVGDEPVAGQLPYDFFLTPTSHFKGL